MASAQALARSLGFRALCECKIKLLEGSGFSDITQQAGDSAGFKFPASFKSFLPCLFLRP